MVEVRNAPETSGVKVRVNKQSDGKPVICKCDVKGGLCGYL